MICIEKRASTVLYKFLISNCQGYHFIIPANVCSVVPLTFLKAGIDFSFVDINPITHAGSFEEIKETVKEFKNLKLGLLYVNAYGCRQNTVNFYKELRILNKELIIIEDDCLCIPVTNRNHPCDDVDLEFYSTGYSKYAQLPIEGGYGFIRNGFNYNDFDEPYNKNGYSEQQQRIKACRKSGEIFVYKENDWLPSACVISGEFTIEDYLTAVRERSITSATQKSVINAIYDSMLPDCIKMGHSYNTWRYSVILPSIEIRNEILDALQADDLFVSAHYQSAAYLYKHVHCINTEREASLILNLFNEEKYSVDQAKRTATIINNIYRKYDK